MRMVLVALIVLISTTTHAFGQDSDWEANEYGRTIGWGIGCGCIEHDESTVNNLLENLFPRFSKKQIQSMKGYIAYGIKSAGRYDNSQQICSSLCYGSNRNEYIQQFNAAVESYLTDPATPSTSKLQSDNRIIALGLTLPQLIERAEHSTFAQLELGKAFEDGRAVPKNLKFAQHWYMKAAIAGYKLAQYKIGWMYESGLGGLPTDKARAIDWYRRAMPIGAAAEALARLGRGNEPLSTSSGLADAQIAEKLRLIKEWLDKGLISEEDAAERRKLLLD